MARGFGAGARETLRRGLSILGVYARAVREAAHDVAAASRERLCAACARWRSACGLYDVLTPGPLIRFVTKTLQRRIIFANTIGLAILLGGIFYLSQYHAWLIDAKRESLRAQGEIIAAAIAANASVETGRIVLDPDRLPEIEGARSPFRDDGFAALQLSIAPERVTPILRRLVPATDTRARVYAQRRHADHRHRPAPVARPAGACRARRRATARTSASRSRTPGRASSPG